MTADAGSRAGTGGTSTSPAPSIPRRPDPLEPLVEPRVPPREAVRPEPRPREPPDEAADPAEAALGPLGPSGVGCLVVGGATGVRVVTGAGVTGWTGREG
jgi:hypothetical protein